MNRDRYPYSMLLVPDLVAEFTVKKSFSNSYQYEGNTW